MKLIKFSFLFLIVVLSFIPCNAQTSDKSNQTDLKSGEVQVYYFHNTNRCVTCLAVEKETKLVLDAFYGDKMKEGVIDFISLNIEEEDGRRVAQSLQVSGQALLLVKGDTHVNLINEGFMNARTNPEKFHQILKTQIDKLL